MYFTVVTNERWLCRCGLDNCQASRAYKVTCSVTGGLCNPCTANSETFHVLPSAIEHSVAGDVQAALDDNPS